MASLTALRLEVTAVLGLSDDDEQLVDSFINEGVADIVVRTQCSVSPITMTTTANIGDYDLSVAILAIVDMYISNDSGDFPFERITPSELLRLRLNASNTSSPARVYALSGANLLMIYPTPTEVETITGVYVPRPNTLSSGSDECSEIPPEYHKLITFYALARAADMDDDYTSEQGERYRALYEQGLREFRRSIYRHGGSRLAPARVNPRRRRMYAHDNSQDI